jgi:hypothetical protein
MSDSAVSAAKEDEVARTRAEQSGLEFREAGAVAIEPHVVSLVPADDCHRLRAVPMSGREGSLLIGVSDPSDERLDAIKELTGSGTRFVVLAERTLDALLHSRMFNNGTRSAAKPTTPEPRDSAKPATERLAELEPDLTEMLSPPPRRERAPAPAAAAPHVLDEKAVDAIVTALEQRLASVEPTPAAAPLLDEQFVDTIVGALDERLAAAASQPALDEQSVETIVSALEERLATAAPVEALPPLLDEQSVATIVSALEQRLAAAPTSAAAPVLDEQFVDAIVAALEERLAVTTSQPALDERSVEAIVAALGDRLSALAPPPGFEHEAVVLPPVAEGTPVGDAVAQLDAMIGLWSNLRAAVQPMHDELEETKRSLREAKEQLSVAYADNDQHRRLLEAQESELSQSQALVEEARLRLKEAAEALFGQAEETSDESEFLGTT